MFSTNGEVYDSRADTDPRAPERHWTCMEGYKALTRLATASYI